MDVRIVAADSGDLLNLSMRIFIASFGALMRQDEDDVRDYEPRGCEVPFVELHDLSI